MPIFDVVAPDTKDQVGEVLTEKATTALTGTGRFIVVERGELDEMIVQQEPTGTDKVRGERVLTPAQQSA